MLGSRVTEVPEASLTGVLPWVTGLKSLVPGGALRSCLFERYLPYIFFYKDYSLPSKRKIEIVWYIVYFSIPSLLSSKSR